MPKSNKTLAVEAWAEYYFPDINTLTYYPVIMAIADGYAKYLNKKNKNKKNGKG